MICDAFTSVCRLRGPHPALGTPQRWWSYEELLRWTHDWAGIFERHATWRAGAWVAIHLPNGPEFPVAFLALTRLGVAAMPVNTAWTSWEIREAFSAVPVSGVITTRQHRAQWAEALPDVLCLLIEDLPGCPDVAPFAGPDSPARSRWIDETALCLMTSGTTGRPKIVMRSQAALLANAHSVGEAIAIRPGSRILPLVPFFHANGFSNGMLMPLLHGGTIVLAPAFVPARTFEYIRESRIDVLIASPFVYAGLADLESEPGSLAGIDAAISSGAPMPPDVFLRSVERLGVRVRQLYGSSETGTIAIEPADTRCPGSSVGQPLRNVEVRIRGGADELHPSGREGRITVRSNALMSGYWSERGPDPVRCLDGFYDTGDLGYVNEDGGLVLTRRSRPFVNAGGNKVSVEEIESVLNRLPGVVGRRVRGAPHERQTEIIEAQLTVTGNVVLSRTDVVAHCRRYLAEYKIPRIITFTTSHQPDLPVKGYVKPTGVDER